MRGACVELGEQKQTPPSPAFAPPLTPQSASGAGFTRMTDADPATEERPSTPARRGTQRDALIRTVSILEPNPSEMHNRIRTALYTWYTFLTIGVLELLYPWSKFANFYFFFVGLMQMSPASLTNGQPSSWATLTFIMMIEVAKT